MGVGEKPAVGAGFRRRSAGLETRSGDRRMLPGMSTVMRNTGAQYEVAIDGTTRTYCDLRELAIEAATRLKTKNPNANVTVHDVEAGETMSWREIAVAR